ncbi:MAG: hypothetical protein QOE60_2076 [Thermoleophilaceae bacterium]|jgi:hypothetical protein|nr:hypothetical protein [Thermoleophilaceae bacterium]
MKDALGKISPATALAALALFVSLGGVSYGVASGSIDSREIQNGTVQSRDVRDGSLQGRDVANGTLRGRDLGDGVLGGANVRDRSLVGADLATNTLGDREIDEPQLDINRLGGIGVSRYVKNVTRVETRSANDAATPKAAPPARCPKGKRLIGGGARVVAPAAVPVALSVNGPGGRAWTAVAFATAPTGSWQLVNVAICG